MTASTSHVDERPRADEFELTLFGPGIGESAVLHVGGGQWIVVDSCLDRKTRRPAALEYLESIGVDVAASVTHVVVTHWHDDHMRGASALLDAAPAARVYCSAALQSREFATLVTASRRAMMESSGVDEMSSILTTLRSRAPERSRDVATGPEWLLADRCILRRAACEGIPEAEAVALSPSSASLTRAMNEIGLLVPAERTPKRRPAPLTANQVAVVLWMRVGAVRLLLGSDLELDPADPRCGWSAIVTSTTRPVAKAHLIKIPHHGSATGDHDAIWRDLVEPSPTALVTPFTPSGLPRDADLKRLVDRTSELYVTSRTRGPNAARRLNAVERTIREVTTDFRSAEGAMRRVRVRDSAIAPTFPLRVEPAEARYSAA